MAQHTETISVYDPAGNLISTRTVTWETTPEQDNEETLNGRATTAMADLRTLASTTGTLTNAQVATGLRLLARAVLALIRLQLRQLDSAD